MFRTSVSDATMLTSGAASTFKVTAPIELAAVPLASGEPTVRKSDTCAGGVHEGFESGAPCVRLAAVQGL